MDKKMKEKIKARVRRFIRDGSAHRVRKIGEKIYYVLKHHVKSIPIRVDSLNRVYVGKPE